MARRADDRADHRRRRCRGRRGRRDGRPAAPGAGQAWRGAGQRWLRSRHGLAATASSGTQADRGDARRGNGLELRQSGCHRGWDPGRREGRRCHVTARRGLVVPRHLLAGRAPAVHAQRTDDAGAVRGQRRRCTLHQRSGALHGFRPRHDRRSALGGDPHPVLADHRHPVISPVCGGRTSPDPQGAVRAGADGTHGAPGLAGFRCGQAGFQLGGTRGGDRSAGRPVARDRRAIQRTGPPGPRRRLQPRGQRLRQLLRRPDPAEPESAPAGGSALLRLPDHPR